MYKGIFNCLINTKRNEQVCFCFFYNDWIQTLTSQTNELLLNYEKSKNLALKTVRFFRKNNIKRNGIKWRRSRQNIQRRLMWCTNSKYASKPVVASGKCVCYFVKNFDSCSPVRTNNRLEIRVVVCSCTILVS